MISMSSRPKHVDCCKGAFCKASHPSKVNAFMRWPCRNKLVEWVLAVQRLFFARVASLMIKKLIHASPQNMLTPSPRVDQDSDGPRQGGQSNLLILGGRRHG